MGPPSKNLYTTGPGDYWQQVTPAVYVDLCSDLCNMALMTVGNTISYVLVHSTPIESLLLDQMSGPIPDDHSHHVTYEAQLHDISRGVPTDVTLHHW